MFILYQIWLLTSVLSRYQATPQRLFNKSESNVELLIQWCTFEDSGIVEHYSMFGSFLMFQNFRVW